MGPAHLAWMWVGSRSTDEVTCLISAPGSGRFAIETKAIEGSRLQCRKELPALHLITGSPIALEGRVRQPAPETRARRAVRRSRADSRGGRAHGGSGSGTSTRTAEGEDACYYQGRLVGLSWSVCRVRLE